MDGVRRIGSEHNVPGRCDRIGKACQSFFGAHGDDHFAFRVKIYPKASLVITGLCSSKAWDTARLRITMCIRLLSDLTQLINHVLRRGLVRISHAQINNVLARTTRRVTHAIDFSNDIGRQSLHAVKIFVHKSYRSAFVFVSMQAGTKHMLFAYETMRI